MTDLYGWHLPRLMSTAARLAEHESNRRLAGLGLTHAGVIALEVLAEAGPAAQNVLAARARVQPQTMGKTLSKLAASGYITRERAPVDGRSLQVSISDLGRAALTGAHSIQRAVPGHQGHALDNLNDSLGKIIRELSKEAPQVRRTPPSATPEP